MQPCKLILTHGGCHADEGDAPSERLLSLIRWLGMVIAEAAHRLYQAEILCCHIQNGANQPQKA